MRILRSVVKACCLALLLLAADFKAQGDEVIARFESLIKAEKFTEASAALQDYTAAHPQSWEAFYQLGYVEFRQHRIQQSLSLLCKSIVLNPNFADSHKILAYDLNLLGRQDLAIHELDQALSYDPVSAESHYELGRIYYEQGSYVKAIEHLEKAKSLTPDSVRIYHNLGLAYSAVAQHSKAVEYFEVGLQLNSRQSQRSAWPLIDYATYLNSRNEFERARNMLLEAVAIDKRWDQEFDELSKAYRGLGQVKEAVAALQHAIALNPHKAQYHYVLARLYTQNQQLTEAKEQLAAYEREKSDHRN